MRDLSPATHAPFLPARSYPLSFPHIHARLSVTTLFATHSKMPFANYFVCHTCTSGEIFLIDRLSSAPVNWIWFTGPIDSTILSIVPHLPREWPARVGRATEGSLQGDHSMPPPSPMPAPRKHPPSLGLYAFAAAAIFLGILGLVWSDFAVNWQRVSLGVPHRIALARLAALIELGAGLGLLLPRTRRAAAGLLTALYTVFVLLWIVPAAAHPTIYDSWGNVFEELSLVFGGLVLCATLAPSASPWAHRQRLFSRLYGICPISFGTDHLIYLAGAATWVPHWIPPGQKFWIIATADFFFLAAIAILSGILAGVAARLLTVMILLFGALIWAPKLAAAPHTHFAWSGNAINFALAAAAWVVSDALSQPARSLRAPARPMAILERIDDYRARRAV